MNFYSFIILLFFCFWLRYHHDSLSKAYDYLLERRSIAAPNLSFFLQLIRYEKELRTTKEIDENKHNDDQQNPIEKLDSNEDPVVSNKEPEDVKMEHWN